MSARNYYLRGKRLALLAVPLALLAAGLKADSMPAAVSPSATATPDPGFMGYTDFTWMNGSNRWTDNSMIDSKWFTPQMIVDVNYVDDFNHPLDHVVSGSTAEGRDREVQVQQLGIGGDMHVDDGNGGTVRGRIMTGLGMDSQMVPRNDETPYRGAWNLAGAYQYITEAYGGYHWNAMHGINLDAGIFPSYVGLYSYYNTDNWTYQASYVSANTPWFFNGVRLQIFPSDQFKSEWWLINGWQTYGMFNDKLAVGFEQKYGSMDGSLSWVANGYVGFDSPDSPSLVRLHSDNSINWRMYQSSDPKAFIARNSWSFTADIGGQQGAVGSATQGAGAPGHTDVTFGPGANEEAFFGAMLYNHTNITDKFGFTFGGGFVNNPGQYLLLLPPVSDPYNNGAPVTAGTYGNAAAYYNAQSQAKGQGFCMPTLSPGASFIGKDFQIAFDYTPNQYLLYRLEFSSSQTNQPYYAGPGGITSSDGWLPAAGTGAVNGYTNNNNSAANSWTPDLIKVEKKIELCMEIEI